MDTRNYVNSIKKSIQDKNNSKRKEIKGELYPLNGPQKAALLGTTLLGFTIIGVAGYMGDKYNKIDNINATINREINDDDNFVLDQERLSTIVESYDLSSKDLYNEYKEAKLALKNKDADSNIVNFNGRDIEIDRSIVEDLMKQTEDNLFYLNEEAAEAIVVVSTDVYLDAQHDLKVEENNASVRR